MSGRTSESQRMHFLSHRTSFEPTWQLNGLTMAPSLKPLFLSKWKHLHALLPKQLMQNTHYQDQKEGPTCVCSTTLLGEQIENQLRLSCKFIQRHGKACAKVRKEENTKSRKQQNRIQKSFSTLDNVDFELTRSFLPQQWHNLRISTSCNISLITN